MKFILRCFLYLITFIVLLVALAYLFFPSQLAAKFLTHKMIESKSKLIIEPNSLTLLFPVGVNLEKIRVYWDSEDIVLLENLSLKADLLKLLKKEGSLLLNSSLADGSVEIKADAKIKDFKKTKEGTIDAIIKNIHLNQIYAIDRYFPQYQVSGKLNIDSNLYIKKDFVEDGSLDLSLIDASVKAEEKVYGIESLDFDFIKIQAKIKQGSDLQLQNLIVKGAQFKGEIKGRISIDRASIQKSKLDLIGFFTPENNFIDEVSKTYSIASLFKDEFGGKKIGFKIKGTIKRPAFSLL